MTTEQAGKAIHDVRRKPAIEEQKHEFVHENRAGEVVVIPWNRSRLPMPEGIDTVQ
jgi:hypothetical protein